MNKHEIQHTRGSESPNSPSHRTRYTPSSDSPSSSNHQTRYTPSSDSPDSPSHRTQYTPSSDSLGSPIHLRTPSSESPDSPSHQTQYTPSSYSLGSPIHLRTPSSESLDSFGSLEPHRRTTQHQVPAELGELPTSAITQTQEATAERREVADPDVQPVRRPESSVQAKPWFHFAFTFLLRWFHKAHTFPFIKWFRRICVLLLSLIFLLGLSTTFVIHATDHQPRPPAVDSSLPNQYSQLYESLTNLVYAVSVSYCNNRGRLNQFDRAMPADSYNREPLSVTYAASLGIQQPLFPCPDYPSLEILRRPRRTDYAPATVQKMETIMLQSLFAGQDVHKRILDLRTFMAEIVKEHSEGTQKIEALQRMKAFSWLDQLDLIIKGSCVPKSFLARLLAQHLLRHLPSCIFSTSTRFIDYFQTSLAKKLRAKLEGKVLGMEMDVKSDYARCVNAYDLEKGSVSWGRERTGLNPTGTVLIREIEVTKMEVCEGLRTAYNETVRLVGSELKWENYGRGEWKIR